jgi:hypothetical protein
MGPQSRMSPYCGNFGTLTWESWDKMTFGCWSRGQPQRYYKGEGGGFPEVQVVMSLMSPRSFVARPSTKSVPPMH